MMLFPVLEWELISVKDLRHYHHPETLEEKNVIIEVQKDESIIKKFQVPNIGKQRRHLWSEETSNLSQIKLCPLSPILPGEEGISLNERAPKSACCERGDIFSEVQYAPIL